jgi:hypothetical protein
MNSESYGKLEDYLAQYMSATSGRQEPPQSSANTVPLPTTKEMENKSSPLEPSSEWSPTCQIWFHTLKSFTNNPQLGAQNLSNKSLPMKTRRLQMLLASSCQRFHLSSHPQRLFDSSPIFAMPRLAKHSFCRVVTAQSCFPTVQMSQLMLK